MKAIEKLVDEHTVILEMLGHLETAAKRIVADEGPPKEFFEIAIDFARTFADKHHHWKEEYAMFGLLAQKHDGTIDEQIERHRSQHEQCRDLIQKMSESLAGYESKLDTPTRVLHRSIDDYVRILRSHIRSENEIFFPMVEAALSKGEDDSLNDAFDKYEDKTGGNLSQMYKKRLAEMSQML
jgi:hemerythrin-like domain-containing protein